MAEIQFDAISWTRDGNNDIMPLLPPKPINYPAEDQVEAEVVYGYDYQYTGTAEAGDQPAAPTLTFLDNFDGATVLVTVAGSTPGTTNTVYARAEVNGGAPLLIATISGDGSATATLPSPGSYLAYVLSTTAANRENIGVGFFSVTAGTGETESLFETTAAAPAREVFYNVFGLPVMYQRGAMQTVLRAIPSDSASKYSELTGFEIETGSKDWTLRSADLVMGGGRIQPKRGDTIRDNIGNLWQILPRDGAPPYIEADPEGVELVVRTKQAERG